MLRKTLILDDIFDPAQGWPYPFHQVPVERGAAHDGNPYYQVRVDGVEVFVFEQTEWADSATRSDSSPARLCVTVPTEFVGVNASGLLEDNADTHGLPGWGLDEDGDLAFHHALPFAEGFPVEWLRRQMLVSIGLSVEAFRDAKALVDAEERGRPARQWESARQVASVAGIFARAMWLGA
ncbi:hypothetical protein GCM10022197_11630 [Microlunatus spumicola]|uniref:Uncharacterized protein n=1 Tax=Microlunatus spumicola TaxID=81499 RepID=A0ABP6WYI3_9ACTN